MIVAELGPIRNCAQYCFRAVNQPSWPDSGRTATAKALKALKSIVWTTIRSGNILCMLCSFLSVRTRGMKACNTRFGISAMFAAWHKALITNSRSFADWACAARTWWQCTLEAMRKPGNASSNDASSRGSAAATSAEFCEPRTHFRTFKRQLLSQRRLRVRVINELFATTRVGR